MDSADEDIVSFLSPGINSQHNSAVLDEFSAVFISETDDMCSVSSTTGQPSTTRTTGAVPTTVLPGEPVCILSRTTDAQLPENQPWF